MEKVSRGIVVTTSEYTKDFLQDCLRSLDTTYPILLVSNDNYDPKMDCIINDWNGFELGGILRGKEHFDEFIHLMDTCVIKDTSLFDKLFDIEGHVFLTAGGFHYMGKFVSKDLPPIPKIYTKQEAIDLELNWLKEREHTSFVPDLPVITDLFEEKYGRINMKLENDYIIKYKARWC